MNKRDLMLSLVQDGNSPEYTPAAFFMHFDSAYHRGRAAVDKHLEFFRYTGMDFVKVQYEQVRSSPRPIRKPEDWAQAPLFPEAFFDDPAGVVRGLVEAVHGEALVVMTVYSPFMWARHMAEGAGFDAHLQEDPSAVSKGLEIMTENVLRLVRACKRAGVDGFYVSTQGGEAFRYLDKTLFEKYIKPTDLAIWDEIASCTFNILHVCDYEGGYDDLAPFLDYPGQVVNCSLELGERRLSAREVSRMFGRPFMGGLERKGVIATGDPEAIRRTVTEALEQAPERYILAADCTVPGETPWENLKLAIDLAHQANRQ